MSKDLQNNLKKIQEGENTSSIWILFKDLTVSK